MGILTYDGQDYDLDDRTLTHLQIVISTKLRRSENFFVSWIMPAERGSGRHVIWVDNGVPLHIYFSGSRQSTVNRAWVEEMMLSASRPTGLVIGPEPTAPEPPSN
jgi:hypothetical protein